MALLRKVADETGQGQWFRYGEDHGKPVRLRIRAIGANVNRELRRSVYAQVKSRKAGNQSVAKGIEHLEEFANARALYALEDAQNFNIELVDAAAVALYGQLLKVEAKPGDEVCLDGKLTDEVKRQLLSDFPRLGGWISDKSDSITQAEVEEEEAATEAF